MAADQLLLSDGVSRLLLSDGSSVLLLSTESADTDDAYPQAIAFTEQHAVSFTSPLTSTSFNESKSLTFQES